MNVYEAKDIVMSFEEQHELCEKTMHLFLSTLEVIALAVDFQTYQKVRILFCEEKISMCVYRSYLAWIIKHSDLINTLNAIKEE